MDVMTFPKIDKPLAVYRFYFVALFHSQTRRHTCMINLYKAKQRKTTVHVYALPTPLLRNYPCINSNKSRFSLNDLCIKFKEVELNCELSVHRMQRS